MNVEQNILKNVEFVSMRGEDITPELPLKLNKVFPKTRGLDLSPEQFLDSEITKFPYLEHLEMSIGGNDFSNERSIRTAINSNLDVSSLCLRGHYDPRTWKTISTKMTNLEALNMSYSEIAKAYCITHSLRKS